MHPSVVKAFVIDHKSARLVAQQLHHVVGSVHEHEDIPAVQVLTHVVVHYPAQHVEVLAHVRRLRVKPELRSFSKTEHGLYAFEDCVHHRGRQAPLDAHVRAGNRAEFNAHPVLNGRDTLRLSAGCGKCRRRFHPGRQAATSYGQEPIRTSALAYFRFHQKYWCSGMPFSFNRAMIAVPFSRASPWISSICSRVSMSVSISGAKLYTT